MGLGTVWGESLHTNDNSDVGVSMKVRPVSGSACRHAVTLFAESLQLPSTGAPGLRPAGPAGTEEPGVGRGELGSRKVLPFPSCLPPFFTHAAILASVAFCPPGELSLYAGLAASTLALTTLSKMQENVVIKNKTQSQKPDHSVSASAAWAAVGDSLNLSASPHF